MIKLTGPGSITTCDGVTRRDFLQVGTLGALGFSLANLARAEAGAQARFSDQSASHLPFGAPSQLECWDPKPAAPREVRGPFSHLD